MRSQHSTLKVLTTVPHLNACLGYRRDRETGTLSYAGNCLSSLTCAVANCRALLAKYVCWAWGINPDKVPEKLKKSLREVQKPKAEGNLVKAKFSEHFQVPFVSQKWVTPVSPYRLWLHMMSQYAAVDRKVRVGLEPDEHSLRQHRRASSDPGFRADRAQADKALWSGYICPVAA